MRSWRTLLGGVLALGFLVTSPRALGEVAPITFVAPHFHEEVTLFGVGPSGELFPGELDLLTQLFRCRRTGLRHAIHPLLIGHLVTMARHFHQPVTVVSGYRAVPIRGHRRSFHLRGMAADVYIPGVRAAELRDAAVTQGVPGIGYYPRSGFIHVDVRDRQFWWVDYSRPGEQLALIPDPEGDAPALPPPDDTAIAQNR